MFIKCYEIGYIHIYEVKDDKSQLLHYFQKEIDSLKVKAPCKLFIHINGDDRKGYRTKLIKLFKKFNKLRTYTAFFTSSERIEDLQE